MTLKVATRVCGPDWRQALASTKAALLYADEVQYQEADIVLWADDGWRFDMRNVPFLIPLFFNPTNPPDLRTAPAAEPLRELERAEKAGVLRGGGLAWTLSLLRDPSDDAYWQTWSPRPDLRQGLDVLAVTPDQPPVLDDPLPQHVVVWDAASRLDPNDPARQGHPHRPLASMVQDHPPAPLQVWSPESAVSSALGAPQAAAAAETALAARLLAELPAFPYADMADVLDVRERLAEPRTRFRAAMAAAGRDLADVPAREFAAAADAYRRENVEVAMLSIEEELEELRAKPTLLWSLKEPWAVPAVASLALARPCSIPARWAQFWRRALA
jgi:hypothetical protein